MIPWETVSNFFYDLSVDVLTVPRLLCFGALIIGYIFGLFQSAYLISKAMHVDIYSKGSGNPGTTNMFRVLGFFPGLLTFILDVGKVVAAILVVRYLFGTVFLISVDPVALTLYTGLGAVLGHDFPVTLRGRGGKGVAATAAVIIMLGEWKYIIVGFVVFFLLFLILRYVSLSSMVMVIVVMFEFLFCTLMRWTYVDTSMLLDCQIIMLIFSILVLVTHRKNIVRLLYAEEPRFTFRRSKEEDAEPAEESDAESKFEAETAEDIETAALIEVADTVVAETEAEGSDSVSDEELVDELMADEKTEEVSGLVPEEDAALTAESEEDGPEPISFRELSEIPYEDSAEENAEESSADESAAGEQAEDSAMEESEAAEESAEDQTETEETAETTAADGLEADEFGEPAEEAAYEDSQETEISEETGTDADDGDQSEHSGETDADSSLSKNMQKKQNRIEAGEYRTRHNKASQPKSKKKHSTTKKKKSKSTKKKR